MNKHDLVIFSQNVRKNKSLTDTILEMQKNNANIIFIQEPPYYLVRRIPSHTNPDGDPLFGTSNHPDWTLFINAPDPANPPRVTTYINKCIAKLRFSLRLNLINHRDINVIAFHDHQDTFLIINVYSDSNQTALGVLCNNIRNIGTTIMMAGDFNIRDSDWDPSYHHHHTQTNDLMIITDSLGLELSLPSNPGLTRFADNPWEANSVLDLVFLNPNDLWFGQNSLAPDLRKPSDHVSLIIRVGINEENIKTIIQSIKKDSEEEQDFIDEIRANIKLLDTRGITDVNALQNIVNQLSSIYSNAWSKFSKPKRITRFSKEWWNQECMNSLNSYQRLGDITSWKHYKTKVQEAKCTFFDDKIFEITSSNK